MTKDNLINLYFSWYFTAEDQEKYTEFCEIFKNIKSTGELKTAIKLLNLIKI